MKASLKVYSSSDVNLVVKTSTNCKGAASYELETIIDNITINIDALVDDQVTTLLTVDGEMFDAVQAPVSFSRSAFFEMLENCIKFYQRTAGKGATAKLGAVYELKYFLIDLVRNEANGLLSKAIAKNNLKKRNGAAFTPWCFDGFERCKVDKIADLATSYDLIEVDAPAGVVYVNSEVATSYEIETIKSIFTAGVWSVIPVLKKASTHDDATPLRDCARA